MKRLFAIFFFLAVMSCKNEGGVTVGSIYPEEAAAVSKDGVIKLLDQAELESSWGKRTGGLKLLAFEVVKGKTDDTAPEDYYMVVARTEEGTKVAALLEMKNDKFYFDTAGQNAESYLLVVCKGACNEGCMPFVKLDNGVQRIVCSTCADCSKKEVEVF
jgi:hypothetical protein